MTACHVCGANSTEVIAGFERLRLVTSDARPWPAGAHLAVCRTCGGVQKVLDAEWYAQTNQIYGGYTIYYQSGGVEQRVFDAAGGAEPRSGRVVDQIIGSGFLPARGRLLDVGCGNGALLRSASRKLNDWTLAGTELDDRYRDIVEGIPRVEALYIDQPNEAPGLFDAITMLHVLEHVPSPVKFVGELQQKLAPDGLLIVQVPEFTQNPFDLLIADHCTHFTRTTLRYVLGQAGYNVLGEPQVWVAKELSVMARPGRRRQETTGVPDPSSPLKAVSWLRSVLQTAESAAAQKPFGIFGTSIAATWLGSELGDGVSFYVDEDRSRIGREHMSRPILDGGSIPEHAHVLVALPGDVGNSVAARLHTARPDVQLHMLPALPC